MIRTVPASAVVPTKHRAESLAKTLNSLLGQDLFPAELIVVDASDDEATKNFLAEFGRRVQPDASVQWLAANVVGAAPQRNEGVARATQPLIWFFDDDIIFEPNCVQRLWNAISSDGQLGGVNAMIVNQRYQTPGFISRTMFTLMHGAREKSFAGRVIGPAINLLPEDREDLPEVVPVEWLNTTCTIYRREALPSPPFDSFFASYSLMEDVTLSLRVAQRGWKLANVRRARIFHDSQSGVDKEKVRSVAAMEIVNRHYVMGNILRTRGPLATLRFIIWQLFQLASVAAQPSFRRNTSAVFLGQLDGLKVIISKRGRIDR